MSAPSAAAGGTFLIGAICLLPRLRYGTMRQVGDGAWGERDDPDECRRVLRRVVPIVSVQNRYSLADRPLSKQPVA